MLLVTGGTHGGFDAASIRFKGGSEIHFVPHMGFKDEFSSEQKVLVRLDSEIKANGTVTFGQFTAMPPGVLRYDVKYLLINRPNSTLILLFLLRLARRWTS